jgi:hypothetical protein
MVYRHYRLFSGSQGNAAVTLAAIKMRTVGRTGSGLVSLLAR